METGKLPSLRDAVRDLGIAVVFSGMVAGLPAVADSVIDDDYIIQGGACVGFDCVNGETLPGTEFRMKENNLRLHLIDSTASGTFGEAWALVANDTSNGGESYMSFAVQSVDDTNDTVNDTETRHVLRFAPGARASVALGPDAELVDDAVSLGTAGTASRLANVAAALAETQVLIKRQMELGGLGAFEATADWIDAQLDAVEGDIEALENAGDDSSTGDGDGGGGGATGPLGLALLMTFMAFLRGWQGRSGQQQGRRQKRVPS